MEKSYNPRTHSPGVLRVVTCLLNCTEHAMPTRGEKANRILTSSTQVTFQASWRASTDPSPRGLWNSQERKASRAVRSCKVATAPDAPHPALERLRPAAPPPLTRDVGPCETLGNF